MISARLVLAFALIPLVSSHIALWDPAMFGYDLNDPNQMEPVLPLQDLTFNEWWFHGYKNKPPAPGTFMTLPSGGTYHGQVACNKALTTFGRVEAQQTGIYACDGDGPQGGIGAMHTTDAWQSPNPTNVKGCGISIAYTSDENSVQPEDFTVISTNWTCPWFKHVDFQIPSDLPPCPEGGCLCSWGWIHSEQSGSNQNYHLVYRCKIDGANGATPLPKPMTANKCDYPTDTSNCTVGGKQPHYWFQKERNNSPQGTYDPPFYNGAYGFMNGAQTDIFAAVGGAKSEPASIDSSSSSAVPASSAASSVAAAALQTSSASAPELPSSSVVSIRSSAVPASSSAAGSLSTVEATSTSASAAPATVSSGAANNKCRRRKRALDILASSPEALKRHQERNAKVAHRRSLRSATRH